MPDYSDHWQKSPAQLASEESAAANADVAAAQKDIDDFKQSADVTYASKTYVDDETKAITDEVSANYLSKADAGTTYATKSDVTQSADSITQAVASDYATKATVQSVDGKATAAQEAANSVATDLSTHYTTSATQKITDDAIKQTVSDNLTTSKTYSDGLVEAESTARSTQITQTATGLDTKITTAQTTADNAGTAASAADGKAVAAAGKAVAAQSAADSAHTLAAAAQSTANAKVTTYYQTAAPTATASGDLWIDTDDGNALHRWSGSAWVLIDNSKLSQALQDAADAQATADGKIVTFAQASAPTAAAVGDLWVDTDDANKLYRWSGSAWSAVRDTGISAAQSAASTADSKAVAAQETATDAQNRVTTQETLIRETSDGVDVGKSVDGEYPEGAPVTRSGSDGAFHIMKKLLGVLTSVASFGEDLIELGKNSMSAVIKFCAGTGEIGVIDSMLTLFADKVGVKGNSQAVLASNGDVTAVASKENTTYTGLAQTAEHAPSSDSDYSYSLMQARCTKNSDSSTVSESYINLTAKPDGTAPATVKASEIAMNSSAQTNKYIRVKTDSSIEVNCPHVESQSVHIGSYNTSTGQPADAGITYIPIYGDAQTPACYLNVQQIQTPSKLILMTVLEAVLDRGSATLSDGVVLSWSGGLACLSVVKQVALPGSWSSVSIGTIPAGKRPLVDISAPALADNHTSANVAVSITAGGNVTANVRGSDPPGTQWMQASVSWKY